jgi:TatD DNase family protein
MQPKLFDTHTHFNFSAFKDDWEAVIERTLEDQVWFVNVGAEAKTSRRAVDMAEKYPEGIYAAVGLHPIHTYDDKFEDTIQGEKVEFVTKAEDLDKEYYTGLAKRSEKVVAVGEIGLDYFHIKKFPAALMKKLKHKQAGIFDEQIKLALELRKPVIIHCRAEKDFDAYKEILEILESNEKVTGIVHCFQGSEKLLEEFLNRGFMIGFNGVITFTEDYDKLVLATPMKRIVLETDAPFLSPVPHRGKRNESIYVAEVARRIAEIKNNTFEEVAGMTTENAMKVFKIRV